MTNILYRSEDHVLGGVCAGLAEYFGFDITLVRIAYVLLTFCTSFCGALVYLILWVIMPEKPLPY